MLDDYYVLNSRRTEEGDKRAKAEYERRMLQKIAEPRYLEILTAAVVKLITNESFEAIGTFEMLGVPFASIVAYTLRKPLLIFRQKGQPPSSADDDPFWRAEIRNRSEFRLLKQSAKGMHSIIILDDYLDTGAQCEAALNICRQSNISVTEALFLEGSEQKRVELQSKFQPTRFVMLQ